MPVITERYNQEKIDILKRYLTREAAKGRKRDYEIIIDGFKAISRTDDIGEFEDYEVEINDMTRNVTIIIYDYNSNRNTQYSFSLNTETLPEKPVNGLGSLGDVNAMIKQQLDDKDKEYQIQRLTEKLTETQGKLEEAEEYHETLQAEIERLKAGKYDFGSLNIVEVGAEIIKHTISSNANKSPFAAQLAGVLGALNQQPALPQVPAQPESEVSFKEHKETPLTEKQKALMRDLEQLERVFSPQQLVLVQQVLIKLMEDPGQLETVAELLNTETEDDGEI